jgi:hypothetical protein
LDVSQIAVVSANFGKFEKPIEDGRVTITEKEFPLRDKSMTPRLQARIVKAHMWQFVPGYGYYLWVDSSCRLKSIDWFMEQVKFYDIAVFKHPHRQTIQQEADYLKERLKINCSYITPRYENELIDEQLAQINPDRRLFASTAFIYKNSPQIQQAMRAWWYQISRYHSIDQLSFSEVIKDLRVNIMAENYENCEGIEYVRNK